MATATSKHIVGQNLKRLREKMSLSQEAVGSFLGISRELISNYETGQRNIPSAHLTVLANLFCVHEYDFFEEDAADQKVNIAFAFKADELKSEDLDSIASFKRVVRNYMDMKKIAANAQ